MPNTPLARGTPAIRIASSVIRSKAGLTNKLELRLHRVRCIDETDPEFWSSDTIDLGGTLVSAAGVTKPVSDVTGSPAGQLRLGKVLLISSPPVAGSE